MQPIKIAEFMANRGMTVVRTTSCWWYNLYWKSGYWQERVYHAFPFHQSVTPDAEEMRELFRKAPKAAAARFLSPWEGGGAASGLWICQGPYDLSRLRRNSRNQTRRGLNNCAVRKLSWEELVERGWESHRDTSERHGEGVPQSLDFDASFKACGAYEAWGAWVKNALAAYLVTISMDDWVVILIARSANAYLKYYPNNALVFRVVSEMLARPGVSTVTYGVDSIVARKSLDYFKSSMGFEHKPIRQRVILRPTLKPLFSSPVCWMVEKIAELPKLKWNNRLQKVAGLCRVVQASYSPQFR